MENSEILPLVENALFSLETQLHYVVSDLGIIDTSEKRSETLGYGNWEVSGPKFCPWKVYELKGDAFNVSNLQMRTESPVNGPK